MHRTTVGFTVAIATFSGLSAIVEAAPPAPQGPHPRIWIGGNTLATMKAKLGTPTSAAAGVVAACKKIAAGQGWITWPESASTCALAYQLTGDAAAAATSLVYWRALIEDDGWNGGKIGNKQGCVAGADATQALRAITHDTGYPIRFIGPHAALAYDWLHDAPGVTEELRTQSRFCFKAWSDYYTTKGYMHETPGSNYQAGFVFAKTLMAVATGGEGGAASDSLWTETVDDLFQKNLVDLGLGPVAAPPSGILVGGDWVEGWQYGPLGVLEYALSARALKEAGASFPEFDAWTDTLLWRVLHATTPSGDGVYVGGDFDNDEKVYLPSHPRVLFAVLAGPSSDKAANYARGLLPATLPTDTTPIYPALAEARGATATPIPQDQPLAYVAPGARRLYARSAFAPDAYWTAFESAPYMGPDHQHFSASSFVFSRGADHLVVDPSAYGSRSTLPTNAVTVDSDVVLGDYKPSQTPWSKADMPFSRTTVAGTAAARGDFAKAFNFADKASDVPFAVRDFVFLPEGEIVTMDRVRTGRADRKTYLRYRSLAKDLALSASAPWTATGTVGGSKLVIHAASISGGTPTIKATAGGPCPDGTRMGACADARFAVWEYNLVLPGPSALAVHVMDGLGTSDEPATVTPFAAGGSVVGASVTRSGRTTHVVGSAAQDGAVGTSLTYNASGASRHVVFDVPMDGSGRYTVTAAPDNGQCKVTLTAGGAPGQSGRPAIFSVAAAASDCTVGEEKDVPPALMSPPGLDGGASSEDSGQRAPISVDDGGVPLASGRDASSSDRPAPRTGDSSSSGCHCQLRRAHGTVVSPWLLALLWAARFARRSRRRG